MTKDEILKKYEDDNEYHFHQVDRQWIMEAMLEYADQQLRLCSFSNWVAVEEKLPPKYENVIIRNENNIVSTDQISDDGWVYEELCELKVTHWQPMPEPPCC